MGMLFALLARRGERGASLVEYALIAAGLASVLILAAPPMFDTLKDIFESDNGLGCPTCSVTPSP